MRVWVYLCLDNPTFGEVSMVMHMVDEQEEKGNTFILPTELCVGIFVLALF